MREKRKRRPGIRSGLKFGSLGSGSLIVSAGRIDETYPGYGDPAGCCLVCGKK